MSDVRRQNSSWSEREQEKGKKARKGQQPPLPRKREREGEGTKKEEGWERYLFGWSTTDYKHERPPASYRRKIDFVIPSSRRGRHGYHGTRPLTHSAYLLLLSPSRCLCSPWRFQLPITRSRRRHTFQLNLCGQVVLCPSRLQGRFCVSDVFGRRVDHMEYDPGRHDTVDDSLQPAGKNRFSLVSFPRWERGTNCVPPCRS